MARTSSDSIQHRYVPGIRGDADVRYASNGSKGVRWNDAHLSQSPLDRSCGLHSFLQAAMILTGIPRRQVMRLSEATRGPLAKLWALARDHYFAGATRQDIAEYCQCFAPDLYCTSFASSNPARAGKAALAAVTAGHVLLVRFDGPGEWSHWLTVVGIELSEDGSRVRALLALDPAASAPWIALSNARLHLDVPTGKALPYRYFSGEHWLVRLREVVVVALAQGP